MLEAIVQTHGPFKPVKLLSLSGNWGTGNQVSATSVSLAIGEQHVGKLECGSDPIDSIFKAITAACQHDATLASCDLAFQVDGAKVTVKVTVVLAASDGRFKSSTHTNPNVLISAASAYLEALNKLLRHRQRNFKQSRRQRGGRIGPDEPNGNLADPRPFRKARLT